MKIKTLFYLAPRSLKLVQALLGMRNQSLLSSQDHLKLCGDWLLEAQEAEGGYAASYSFVLGLRHAYIETTGYIIPTLLDLAVLVDDSRYRASAFRAGEWLLSVQQQSGAFTDIDDYNPQVFDTGQVMLGLNRLYKETKDQRYLDATKRAADWLVSVQDEDGSWTSAGYHRGSPCVYLSRVAAAILEAAQLTGETRHYKSGVKFLEWAASRQQENGFFLNCELSPNADPVLHTLVYVLEGFLMAYQTTGHRQWLEILLRGARPILKVQRERDLVPCSQYDPSWNVTNDEKCIPGLAQWAGLALALHNITDDSEWLDAAILTIYYLKSKHLRGKGILNGALPASVPLWGFYHPLMLPNWAVKFFADALMLYERHKVAVWQEQEKWVSKCFALQQDGGNWSAQSYQLEPLDTLVLQCIHDAVSATAKPSGKALDVGCGEGRYLQHLKHKLPSWKFQGVDPCSDSTEGEIRAGSAYHLPFPDGSFDVVYTWITLQHVADMQRALGELLRVLKPGGKLILGDRDLWSGRGLSKPWHEIKGRWMYPWDSPFRERWYSLGKWRSMVKAAGFTIEKSQRVQNPGDKGLRRLARMNSFVLLTLSAPVATE